MVAVAAATVVAARVVSEGGPSQPGDPVKRSNNAFLKRQKELARQQRKQEKRDRLNTQRGNKGSLDSGALDADASDLEALGLEARIGLAKPEEPTEPEEPAK